MTVLYFRSNRASAYIAFLDGSIVNLSVGAVRPDWLPAGYVLAIELSTTDQWLDNIIEYFEKNGPMVEKVLDNA